MRGFSKYVILALGMAVFEARMAMALDMDNVIQQVLGTDDGDDAATDAIVQHAATGLGMESDDVDDLLGDDKPMKDDNPYKGLFGSEDGPTSTVGESYSPMPQTTAIPTATGSSAAKPTSIGPYSNSTSTHSPTRPGSTPAVASKTGSANACEPTAGATPTGRYTSKTNETCLGGTTSNSHSKSSNSTHLEGSPTSTGKSSPSPSPSLRLPGLFDSGAVNGHLLYQETFGGVYAMVMVVIGAVLFL